MPVYKAGRLLIAVDDTSGTLTVVPRPSGRRVPIAEIQFSGLSSPPAIRIDQVNDRVHDLANAPALQITTEWRLNDARITRRFLTPVQALAERIECFDIRYTFEAEKGLDFTPLLFVPPCAAEQSLAGFTVRSGLFRMIVRASADESAQARLEPAAGSDGLAIRIVASGDAEVGLSFLIVPDHQGYRDTALHIVPPALDGPTFVLAALTPALLPFPLALRPVAALGRGSPLLLLSGAASPPHQSFWASLVSKRVGAAVPPPEYPSGDLVRMSDVVLYHLCADRHDLLTRTVSYLQHLEPGRLPSTQLMVAISDDDEAAARLQAIVAALGVVQLSTTSLAPSPLRFRQLQCQKSIEIPTVLAQIDADMDVLRMGPGTRKALKDQLASPPLPPMRVPLDVDPLVQVPFLAAARLRGTHDFTSVSEPWPFALSGSQPPQAAAEVARYLLADIQTHELLRAATDASHEATWKSCLASIDRGEMAADRLVFAVVSGADVRYDRLKLLPPLLYSRHIPSPVFPMRLALSEQEGILKRFATYMEAVYHYWMAIQDHRPGGAVPVSNVTLETSSRRLQECFQGEAWAALGKLVALVKPKEFINFSTLPMDWWEIDGIPLGQLTKVVTLHSQTAASDAGLCADLPTIYNSLVMPELTPAAPELRVLIIAPTYEGEDHVNVTVGSLAQAAQDELRSARAAGRDVVWEVVQPRTANDLKTRLEERWPLLIYIGHAAEGVLLLPDGEFSTPDFPAHAMLGVTAVLIGCDTKGASNLSRSVASKMLSAGARAVFSTSYPLPLMLGEHLFHTLLRSLLRENLENGDVVAGVRVWMLHNFRIRAMAADLDLPARHDLAVVTPQMQRGFHQDSWRKVWDTSTSELVESLLDGSRDPSRGGDTRAYVAAIMKRAATAGLSLTFAGDLRARLFAY